MSTNLGYQKHDPLRACDICGVEWHKSELRRIAPLRYACPDDVDGLTAEQISRHNANVRPLLIKPVKNAKGATQTPTFQQAEASVLNLVLSNSTESALLDESGAFVPASSATNLDKARALGWSALYLGNLVLEDRRPRRWIEQASVKLRSLCDTLRASQFGIGDTYPVGRTQYGAVYLDQPANLSSMTLSLDTVGTAVCLMAFLRAYQVLGDTKYLTSARACATFLRRAQCVGLYFGSWAATDAAGTRLQPGPFPDFVTYDFNQDEPFAVDDYSFRPTGIICAWALNALRSVAGDASYGGSASDFVTDAAALLSDSVAACVAWWSDGFGGTVGFGPDTPRDSYTAPANSGTGAWVTNTGSIISGFEYAAGVRALYEIGGYTAQVAALYSWLRSFASDSANRVPATWDSIHREKSTLGTYDASIALARWLNPSALTEATDLEPGGGCSVPGYDWRTVGLLAPIQSARDSGALGVAKDQLTKWRRRRFTARLSGGLPTSLTLSSARYDPVDINETALMLGFTGLSYQTSVGVRGRDWPGLAFAHYIDVAGVCIAADAFRHAPGAFPLEQG